MQRREFLQSVATITAGLALPASVRGFAGLIGSDVELVDWLEATFRCQLGAPWAFAEPRPDWAADVAMIGVMPDGTEEEDLRWNDLTPYMTFKAEDYDSPARRILADLQALVAAHPEVAGTDLWWRYPEKVKASESWYQDKGPCLMTAEQCEDRADWPTAEQAAAMTPEIRAALQEAFDRLDAVATPAGCVGKIFGDGAIYLAAGEPWAVRSVRTRIAIPALHKLALRDLDNPVLIPATYDASDRARISESYERISTVNAVQVGEL